MGFSYAGLALKSKKDGIYLVHTLSMDAEKGKSEKETVVMKMAGTTHTAYFRVQVTTGGKCQFSYSLDGSSFTATGDEFTAEVGRWKGAKVGLFCTREAVSNDSGFADVDWFRVERLK
jgi:hypothetical protein